MQVHTGTHMYTSPDVKLVVGEEWGGKPVRYLPSCIGSIKTQRKMKCSTWHAVSRPSHFILISSFYHLTASIQNSTSCQGCALFHSWQGTVFLYHCWFTWPFAMVYLLLNVTMRICVYSICPSPQPQSVPSHGHKGLPTELCMEQAPGLQNSTRDKHAPGWPSNGWARYAPTNTDHEL